ncbi:purine catabolism regulatory protein [bacterium BMS3Abin01]|nr:purine catabolism regulatory protein [bacterium BMS3Abin01]
MALTVSDILELPILAEAKVLAGKDGMSRQVTQVTVGEVPDIGDWLTGSELVLSTFFGVETTPEAQTEFVRKIIKSGAAGLLLKPERFIKAVDSEMIALGDRNSFPVIEVPAEVRWTHVIADISERIVGEHLSLLERSRDIHQKLLDVVINGGSWQSIADTTVELLGRPVLLEDSFFDILANAVPEGSDTGIIDSFDEMRKTGRREVRPEGLSRSERYQRVNLEQKKEFPAKVTVPIVVSHDVLGYVSSFEIDSALNELDLIALESAATIAALEMGRELVRMETENRLRGDFVDDLLAGEFNAGPTMLQRASYLGGDLSRGCMVLIADIDSFGDYVINNKLKEPEVQRIKNRYFGGIKQVIRSYHEKALLTPRSDNVIAFLPPLAGEEGKLQSVARSTAAKIRLTCRELLPDLTVSIGLGRFHEKPGETGRAYREAQTALRVSQRLGETGAIATFDDMGIYKLLLSALEEDPEEVRNFYEETIAVIQRYDKEHKTDLVGTLETFLANNRSVAATAESLFTHRHTIRYRLGRIADLTGLNVNKSEDQEKLGFGLKAMRLLRR